MKPKLRSVLALLLATAGCELISAVDHDLIDAPSCPPDMSLCEGACWDLRVSVQHCGGCGRFCGVSGAVCTGGTCGCPGGGANCGAFCVVTTSDPFNCGGCGRACAMSEACVSGRCVPCPLTVCGDVCVDLGSDPFHCGQCGRFCSSGVCIAARCSSDGAGRDASDAPSDIDVDAPDASDAPADGSEAGPDDAEPDRDRAQG